MRVAVVGSRTFIEPKLVVAVVQDLPDDAIVVSGGAKGVDSWAVRAARDVGMECDVFPADWEKHGKSAGIIRNKEMVESVDRVIAFWDGESSGTRHSIKLAYKLNLPLDLYIRRQ